MSQNTILQTSEIDTKVVANKAYKRKKNKIAKLFCSIFVWIFTLTAIFPFIWMVGASFKKAPDIFAVQFKLFPNYIYLYNYITIWEGKYNYPLMYLNSIKVTSISVVLCLITSCLAGYGFSKLKFFGRDAVFLVYLSAMMIPAQLLWVPKFMMFSEIGIYNTHLALILPATFSIFGVFMMRQYMSQIPQSISEAAKIDGAGDLRICVQIISPLCKSAILTLVIIFFTWNWNDYDNALIFLRDKELYTVNLGLTYFMDETGMQYNLIMAACSLSILPIFAIFLVAQKYFVGGLAAGGVKG